MHPGSSDTDPQTAAVQLELLRRATPERRLQLAFSLSRSVMALTRDSLARQSPDESEQEIGLRFVAQCYGRELAEQVRAWLARRRP